MNQTQTDEMLAVAKQIFGVEPRDISSDMDCPAWEIEGFTIFETDKPRMRDNFLCGQIEVGKYWEVGYETVDNGTRWEPPSSDYVTLNSKLTSWEDALRLIAVKLAEQRTDNIMQEHFWAKMAQDEEEYNAAAEAHFSKLE